MALTEEAQAHRARHVPAGDARAKATHPPRRLLIALSAIGPASFQIFLPSLPAIRETFGISAGTAQLALSLSMLGIALATLAYGGLSDRFGRRPLLLAGMALLTAGSLVCAAAPSIEVLILGRIVQAAGGASGMVVTRAVVLDVYGREASGRVMAGLLAAMMIAPMLATPLGGFLNDAASWRANFLVIAAAGAAAFTLTALRLPETASLEGASGRGSPLAGFGKLLRSREFDAFAFQGAFGMVAFTVFMTSAPYALSGALGLTAAQVGYAFVAISAGFAAGSLLAARLPDALTYARRVRIGSVLGFAATAAGLAAALSGQWSLWWVLAPMAAYGVTLGVTMPASQAGAVGAEPTLAGTASGLSGFLGTALAAAATQVAGLAANGTPVPVAIGVCAAALASLGAAFLLPATPPAHMEPAHSRA